MLKIVALAFLRTVSVFKANRDVKRSVIRRLFFKFRIKYKLCLISLIEFVISIHFNSKEVYSIRFRNAKNVCCGLLQNQKSQ